MTIIWGDGALRPIAEDSDFGYVVEQYKPVGVGQGCLDENFISVLKFVFQELTPA